MKNIFQKMNKKGFKMTCLDVGARGGFTEDLLPIASLVDAIGFEPDKKECKILNRNINKGPWRSLKYLPTALGSKNRTKLNLYRKRGCSSLLEANKELAKDFHRDDYFILDRQIDIPVTALDDAAMNYRFEDACYIKIDIQGSELEVFNSGKNILAKSVMGIRAEVSFTAIYKNQPLFADIDIFLKKLGFQLMQFIELHHWRRDTKIKYPRRSKNKYPLSYGQLVHGDALYLRSPKSLSIETEPEKERALKLALIAMCYGHIDHAQAVLKQDKVSEYAREVYGVKADNLLRGASRAYLKSTRINLLRELALNAKNLIKIF